MPLGIEEAIKLAYRGELAGDRRRLQPPAGEIAEIGANVVAICLGNAVRCGESGEVFEVCAISRKRIRPRAALRREHVKK